MDGRVRLRRPLTVADRHGVSVVAGDFVDNLKGGTGCEVVRENLKGGTGCEVVRENLKGGTGCEVVRGC